MTTSVTKNKALTKEGKLIDFVWEAKTAESKQKGEMAAASANVVNNHLRRARLTPIVVKMMPKPLLGGEGIKEASLVTRVRQFLNMINAGVPIVQSFELLISATSQPSMRKLLKGILRHLNERKSLSQSLARYGKNFDRLFVSLVAAGEHGSILDTILLRLADYREKSLALVKRSSRPCSTSLPSLASWSWW